MIITGNDTATVGKLKRFLHNHFRIKDLGNLKYFLGIEVAYSKQGIAISQRKYTLDILKDAGMIGSRPTKIPMEQNQRLTPSEGELLKDPSHIDALSAVFYISPSQGQTLPYQYTFSANSCSNQGNLTWMQLTVSYDI